MGIFKKFLAILTVFAMLTVSFCFTASADYDNINEYAIKGINSAIGNDGVYLFTNEGSSARVILASDYNFSGKRIMIFNAEGRLIEAGGDIFANSGVVNGSPQLSVTIPPKGFMISFAESASTSLASCCKTAMEGAMLYNATMAVGYEVFANYNLNTNKIYVKYNNPVTPPTTAKRFLFVGNSSTYFNGTPIIFKYLAKAAGVDIVVDYCTYGSSALSQFADSTHERGIALRNKLKNNNYDYVVLQDANAADYEALRERLNVLVPLIEENGAEALLYMRYGFADSKEKRIAEANRHHIIYTKLATEFGLGCANAADAFPVCFDKYPQINLYADDGNHHSAAAAYMIACVWLYDYLGISPVNNSFTATQSEAAAKQLQECANMAATEGYAYPNTRDYITIDGVDYKNIALNKEYIPSGDAYGNKDWTDTDPQGNPLGKLTDGVVATGGGDTAIGCYKGNNTSVEINLGKSYDIYGFYTDLYGGQWGVDDVTNATVKFEYSADGENYSEITPVNAVQTQDNGWSKKDFSFKLTQPVRASYVRVSYSIDGSYCWSSEIAVYGKAYTEPTPDPDPNPDPNPDVDPNPDIDPEPTKGIKGDINGNGKIDARDYLLLKRAYFGTYTLTCDNEISDINGNNKLDARDYLLLKRAYFGTYTIQ